MSDGLVSGAELDATYWARNLREPVRLSQGIAALAAERPTCFVEVGPHPVVLRSIEAALLGRDPSLAVLIEDATIESGLRFRNRAPQRSCALADHARHRQVQARE